MTNNEEVREAKLNKERNRDRLKKAKKVIKGVIPKPETNIAEWLILGGAAFLIDLVDVLDLTGVGIIIARAIDIPALIGIGLWLLIKQHKLPTPQKDPVFMLFFAFLGELSPGGILPFWTAYIFYLWLRQTRLGRKVIARGVKKFRAKK